MEPAYKWELVAVVPLEESYEKDIRDLVPLDKRYSPEEEERIQNSFYKIEFWAYESGPFLGRQVGQTFGPEELWPILEDDLEGEEEFAGIYRVILLD